jgi:hypothetical protein
MTVTFINVDGWPNEPTASFRVLNPHRRLAFAFFRLPMAMREV